MTQSTIRHEPLDPVGAATADAVFRATVARSATADDAPDTGIPALHPDVFRDTMGAFPTPVSVVTALDDDGAPRGLTCSAVCSLSADPPTLLVCVNQQNGSLDAIRHSGGFVVNLLHAGSSAISDRFASRSPDKYDGISWSPSTVSGLPWLHDDALAHADCRLVADLEAGSHAILIGQLQHGASVAEPAEPLLYWRRAYGSWRASAPAPSDEPAAPPAAADAPASSPAPPVPRQEGSAMHRDQIADELERYVRTTFLDGDDDELSRTTPLLQWGVLNSMNTALLLTHIRDDMGVVVPPTDLNGANFRDLDSITDLVAGLAAAR